MGLTAIIFWIVFFSGLAYPPSLIITIPTLLIAACRLNRRGRTMLRRARNGVDDYHLKQRYKSAQAIRSMFP